MAKQKSTKRSKGPKASSDASGKELVIVESPAKARTINKYLGSDYVVMASMGHVRDLPTSGLAVDIENNFSPTYRSVPTRKKIIGELQKIADRAETVYLGAEKNPDEIVEKACETGAQAILISTHNGMALDYSKRLKEELRERNLNIPVIMGGVLNQKIEGQALPVDVSKGIKELGFYPSATLDGRLSRMLDFIEKK